MCYSIAHSLSYIYHLSVIILDFYLWPRWTPKDHLLDLNTIFIEDTLCIVFIGYEAVVDAELKFEKDEWKKEKKLINTI